MNFNFGYWPTYQHPMAMYPLQQNYNQVTGSSQVESSQADLDKNNDDHKESVKKFSEAMQSQNS